MILPPIDTISQYVSVFSVSPTQNKQVTIKYIESEGTVTTDVTVMLYNKQGVSITDGKYGKVDINV